MKITLEILVGEIKNNIKIDYITLKHSKLNDIIIEFKGIDYFKHKNKYFITLRTPNLVQHNYEGYVKDIDLNYNILKESVLNEVSINNKIIKRANIRFSQ